MQKRLCGKCALESVERPLPTAGCRQTPTEKPNYNCDINVQCKPPPHLTNTMYSICTYISYTYVRYIYFIHICTVHILHLHMYGTVWFWSRDAPVRYTHTSFDSQ
jgi:hypothetical protein